MGFATPWLWALMAGLAVPLFVHLARRPHDTGRAVASLMFLKRHEVRQTRARTLRDRWLLLARALVLACLVAALAEPYVERLLGASDRPQATVLIVDQSASMQALEREAEAQRAFSQFLGSLSGTATPVAMLGATGSSRQLLDFTTDVDALRAAFNAATPLPEKGRLRPALQHATDLLAEAGYSSGRITLISDLQLSAMPTSEGPFALGAGLGIGVAEQVIATNPDSNGYFEILLFVLILIGVAGSVRASRDDTEPWAAVTSGASAGSSEVTPVPSAGPLTLTKTMPSRLAMYSISVVLP